MAPPWLSLVSEEDADMKYTTDHRVSITGNTVSFVDLDDEDDEYLEQLDLEQMQTCDTELFYDFEFTEATPVCIVLDCENTRVPVDPQGYVLTEHGLRTKTRLFDPDLLADNEQFEDFQVVEMVDAKRSWLQSVLKQSFPGETDLSLSLNG
jgi:hypothetical protein